MAMQPDDISVPMNVAGASPTLQQQDAIPGRLVRLRRGGPTLARKVVIRAVQLAAGLLVWHAVVAVLAIDPQIVPRPLDVVRMLWALAMSGQLTDATWVTLQETLVGFVIGSVLGIGLAVLLSEVRVLRQILQPYVVALQAVPKVAVAPLFLIWFGFGIQSKVALVISIMFFPVLVNTLVGLESVDADQLELMRAYRASRWQTLRRVKLYVALPYVFASFEVCLVLSLTAAVVAEMLGSGTTIGLGTLINIYSARMASVAVFAVLVVLSVLGVVLHGLVLLAASRCLSWQRPPGR
jgi:NitT/TauT family transport system permease protein